MSSGEDDARHAQAEVLVELLVLGGDDRLAQPRRDLVVADDDPALGRELADDRAVVRVDAGDGVRRVVVERGDLRQVAGEDEEHTAHRSEHRGDGKERYDQRLTCDTNDYSRHRDLWTLTPGGTTPRHQDAATDTFGRFANQSSGRRGADCCARAIIV